MVGKLEKRKFASLLTLFHDLMQAAQVKSNIFRFSGFVLTEDEV